MITLFEKAAAIAIKLENILDYIPECKIVFRPEYILRKATSEEIDFYYNKMIKGEVNDEMLVPGLSAI